MSLTLLILAAVGVVLSGASVMAARGREHALAGEQTVVGLGDPASDTLPCTGERAQPSGTEWQVTTVASLSAAEQLLDCLEAQGYAEREMVILGNSSFAIRWR
ncbi:MAG TPA: hypothetical protein VKE74_17930 [Gemmataceae bacterium]|nr:hypothetical protein [Gemmataceae bacterium]